MPKSLHVRLDDSSAAALEVVRAGGMSDSEETCRLPTTTDARSARKPQHLRALVQADFMINSWRFTKNPEPESEGRTARRAPRRRARPTDAALQRLARRSPDGRGRAVLLDRELLVVVYRRGHHVLLEAAQDGGRPIAAFVATGGRVDTTAGG